MIKAQAESNKIECCCPNSKFMVVDNKNLKCFKIKMAQ